MTQPLVSIITPTTPSRAHFIDRLRLLIERQTLQPLEWLIDEGSGTIGAKRNRLWQKAKGDIVLHMDDDDLYMPNYIEQAVNSLCNAKCNLIGLHKFPMHNAKTNAIHMFDNPGYIAEATFCYYRDGFCGFPDKQTREGEYPLRQMKFTSYPSNDFMATVHGGNTCGHKTLPLIKKLHPADAAMLLNRFYD